MQKGFTLIEIILVITIISILTAIAVPTFSKRVIHHSKVAAVKVNHNLIVTSISMFIIENNCLPKQNSDMNTYLPANDKNDFIEALLDKPKGAVYVVEYQKDSVTVKSFLSKQLVNQLIDIYTFTESPTQTPIPTNPTLTPAPTIIPIPTAIPVISPTPTTMPTPAVTPIPTDDPEYKPTITASGFYYKNQNGNGGYIIFSVFVDEELVFSSGEIQVNPGKSWVYTYVPDGGKYTVEFTIDSRGNDVEPLITNIRYTE